MPSPFSTNDMKNVERLAKGLSPDEVIECWGLTLDELDPEDMDLFSRAYRKGRALAKAQAVESLFMQMDAKDGGKNALAYLTRMAKEWESDDNLSAAGHRILRIEFED